MGAVVSKPSPERLQELKDALPAALTAAASAIASADVLLLATGAGWSADSGLAVYRDVADVPAYRELGLEYHDICQPHWVDQHPPLFYGFWGMCFNDYQTHKPHEGYDIIRRWKEQRFSGSTSSPSSSRSPTGSRSPLGSPATAAPVTSSSSPSSSLRSPHPSGAAFFSVTSNVDGHFRKAGFQESEIREIHGSVDVWQCSRGPSCCGTPSSSSHNEGGAMQHLLNGGDGGDGSGCSTPTSTSASTSSRGSPAFGRQQQQQQQQHQIWRRPDGYMFAVDEETKMARLGAPSRDVPDDAAAAAAGGGGGGGGGSGDPEAPSDAAVRSFRGRNQPVCPSCGARARPAILMFGDGSWVDDDDQEQRFKEFTTALLRRAYTSGRNYKAVAADEADDDDDNNNDDEEEEEEDQRGGRNDDDDYDDDNDDDDDEEGGGSGRRRWSRGAGKKRRVEEEDRSRCGSPSSSGRELVDPPLRVAVLEIGCGDRVPTIRRITEDLVAEVNGAGGVATLVRVNPDFPDADRSDLVPWCVPVASRGLAAVKAIDALLPCLEDLGGGPPGSPRAAAAADASVRSAILSLNQNATATSPRKAPLTMPPGGRFGNGGGGGGFQHPAYDDDDEEEEEEEEEERGISFGSKPVRLCLGQESDEEDVEITDLPMPMSLGSNADPSHWQELERCLIDAVASQSVSPRPSCTGCDLASRRSSLSGSEVPSAVLGCSGIRSG